MSTPAIEGRGRRIGRAGWALTGLALLLAGWSGAAPAASAAVVSARLGPITVSATALLPGPGGALTSSVQVSTSGPSSDQLDAAIAADGAPVAVYHEQGNVANIADVASCGGIVPPPGVADQWFHYGPMLVPGRSGGPSLSATAILTVGPVAAGPAGRTLAITLYFAHAGSLILRLPLGRA